MSLWVSAARAPAIWLGGVSIPNMELPSGFRVFSQFSDGPKALTSAQEPALFFTFSQSSAPHSAQSPPWLFIKCSFYLLLMLLITKWEKRQHLLTVIVLNSYLITSLLTIMLHLWHVLPTHLLLMYWAPTTSRALGEALRVQGHMISSLHTELRVHFVTHLIRQQDFSICCSLLFPSPLFLWPLPHALITSDFSVSQPQSPTYSFLPKTSWWQI